MTNNPDKLCQAMRETWPSVSKIETSKEGTWPADEEQADSWLHNRKFRYEGEPCK